MLQGFGWLTRIADPTEISADNPWYQVNDGDPRVRGMLNRHYSRLRYKDGRRPMKALGPGEYVLLMTPDSRAVFSWVRNTVERRDGQEGLYCTLFRNEAPERYLSSDLILAAEKFAAWRWPEVPRMFTYVAPDVVKSANPGYCFKVAGWKRRGKSASGKVLLDKWHDSKALVVRW